MKVYYYQNGNWIAYKSAKILNTNSFSYVPTSTGKQIVVKGKEIGFEDTGVSKPLPKATYFKNINPKSGPKIFAFLATSSSSNEAPSKPSLEPVPEPEIGLPEEKKFPWGWALVGVVGGYMAYSYYKKKGRK